MLKQIIHSLLITLCVYISHQPVLHADTDMDAVISEYSHNSKNWPLLHYAIEQGRLDVAEIALILYPEQATQSTPPIKIMESHFGNNASDDYDFFMHHERGISALELAVKKGYLPLATQLIELGADAKELREEQIGDWSNSWDDKERGMQHEIIKFRTGQTQTTSILYHAIIAEDEPMVELLLQHNAPINECFTERDWGDVKKQGALRVALDHEAHSILKKIIHHQALRANRKVVSEDSITNQDIEILSPHILNFAYLPPLHHALQVGDFEGFYLLYQLGEDPNFQAEYPYSVINPPYATLTLKKPQNVFDLAITNEDQRYINLLLEDPFLSQSTK